MTTSVGIYRFNSAGEIGRLRLACRLVETAFTRGHKVFVATMDEASSEEVDRLLWTFKWWSFIPHTNQSNTFANIEQYPVIIGHSAPPTEMTDVLVLTRDQVPDYAAQFDRIVDPVNSQRQEIELALNRERQYLELTGVTPVKHEV